LNTLPNTSNTGTRAGAKNFHKITIVVLDAHDRRVGESYWSEDFSVVSAIF
jgi:hypothetical protein